MLSRTRLQRPPAVPELLLHLADGMDPLWEDLARELDRGDLPPPFWAFAWLGGQALARHVLERCRFPDTAAIAGFWPMGREINIRPLLVALAESGRAVLLPETPPRGQPLRFRRWRPGCAMVPERFGTLRPDGEVAVPGLLLVPLLAFDRAGRRLGYGGGYYDRTLAALPGVPS